MMSAASEGPPDEPGGGRVLAVQDEQLRWRSTLLRVITRVVACVSVVALVSGLREADALGAMQWPFFAIILSAPVAMIERLGYRLRVVWTVAGIYTISMIVTLAGGFMPNTSVALCAGAIIATLLQGPRSGIAFTALSAATLSVISLLFVHGQVVLPANWASSHDVSVPVSAVRIILVFAMLTTVVIAGVHYAVSRAEALLLEKTQALAALERATREKERVTAELAARDEIVRRASEMAVLGRLAGFAAHDVNNALLVIQASVDSAREDPEALRDGAVLDTIADATDSAAATMRQLRAFGRSGGVSAAAPHSAAAQLKKVARLLRHLLPSSVEIRAELGDDASIHVCESEFQRVILNLALNARDAMPQGGVLTLRTHCARDTPGSITIDVSDTGAGMDEGTLAKVFEPFFTTKGAAGTGLGLASVREVVQSHGGQVTVRSALGAGTTFSMRWPLANRLTPATSARLNAGQRLRHTVLLVDDDAVIRRMVMRMLEQSGCSVLDAPDGAQALLVARRYHGTIDALITDCMMPGMPVRQLVSSFRKAHPDARVIMSSGHAPEEVDLQELQVDVFLPKPFTRADLTAALSAEPAIHPQRSLLV